MADQVFTAMRTKIAPIAAQDDMVWHDGDGSRGYQQLLTEYIPIRTKQLLQVDQAAVFFASSVLVKRLSLHLTNHVALRPLHIISHNASTALWHKTNAHATEWSVAQFIAA